MSKGKLERRVEFIKEKSNNVGLRREFSDFKFNNRPELSSCCV